MNQLVISCSLSPTSHSALMANRLVNELREVGDETELVDLRDVSLPFCDGNADYDDTNVAMLSAKIEAAHAVALAMPIYNYDVGGAARNLIAMTGSSWKEQIVGLLGAAGGRSSYMSLMPIGNSLMLDFRCIILPRFVYATRQSFGNGKLINAAIQERLARLAGDMHHFASCLSQLNDSPENSSQKCTKGSR